MIYERIAEEREVRFVAKDGDTEAGRISLMAPLHLEGPEVQPPYKGTTLFKTLVLKAEQEARDMGMKVVFAYGVNEQMEDYISRLGYTRKPWSVWEKAI